MSDANAVFGTFMPLHISGQLAYGYSYATNSSSESETTSFNGSVKAAGYIWRPWFATTSMALNIGLSNTETQASSADSTSVTGSLTFSVFPRSRFPFSLSYSQSDNLSESYFDLTQVSGEVRSKVTRLSLRQRYQPRGGNQSYNGWYYTTDFSGAAFDSKSLAYGLTYDLRLPRQNVAVTALHSENQTKGSDIKPLTDVISVSHVYTPSPEIGVNSLGSFVESDIGINNTVSLNSQLASSFFWRPEHRSIGVSGGVRLSESKTRGGASNTLTRSLNTNLGLSYRLTRAFRINANAAIGASDGGGLRTLTSNQTVGMSYTGNQREILGFNYSWSSSASMSNSTTQTDSGADDTSSDNQSLGVGVGHGINRSWSMGNSSSVSMSLSESLSAGKNTSVDLVTKSLSHSMGVSWNRRGRRGGSHANIRVSDSRTFADKDSVFQQFGFGLNQDLTINRLSRLNGNISYQASRSELVGDLGEALESSSQSASGSMTYNHSRPFGVYNLSFTSGLIASKQIGRGLPDGTLSWNGRFNYSLGLLSTTLTFRALKSASGSISKSLSFRATRSF